MTIKNKTEPKREVYKRSDNGQFTTKKFAEKHPDTTYKTSIKVNPPKKK